MCDSRGVSQGDHEMFGDDQERSSEMPPLHEQYEYFEQLMDASVDAGLAELRRFHEDDYESWEQSLERQLETAKKLRACGGGYACE